MVVDFADIKAIVQAHVIDKIDHSLALGAADKSRFPDLVESEKIIYLPYSPTCEMLLIHITRALSKLLPNNITLQTIRLSETPTSYAEWHAEENR